MARSRITKKPFNNLNVDLDVHVQGHETSVDQIKRCIHVMSEEALEPRKVNPNKTFFFLPLSPSPHHLPYVPTSPPPPLPFSVMAFCRSCIVSFSRSASLRPFAPLATSVRPRPCAAPATTPSLLSGIQQPSARALFHTGVQGRSQVLLARQSPLLSSLSRQRRLNSNAATATLDASSPTTTLKVHNPQFDESGKELVIDITDKAVKVSKTYLCSANCCCSLGAMMDPQQ
jgi:hypothetical protein